MPSRTVPCIHQLSPLIRTILGDLYGEFNFTNSAYFPLVATSTIQHIPVTVDGCTQSETVCKWYKDDNSKQLQAALAFHSGDDTVLFADIFMRQSSEDTVRIKLRCVNNTDHLGCYENKAVALVSTGSEWQRMVERSVRPMIAKAMERDSAFVLYSQPN